MHVHRETPDDTDARRRSVLAAADLEELAGTWWRHELPPSVRPNHARPSAIALVRDERLRVWSFHFPPDLDNSGFVGWLASEVKRRTGSGVLVVCGQAVAGSTTTGPVPPRSASRSCAWSARSVAALPDAPDGFSSGEGWPCQAAGNVCRAANLAGGIFRRHQEWTS